MITILSRVDLAFSVSKIYVSGKILSKTHMLNFNLDLKLTHCPILLLTYCCAVVGRPHSAVTLVLQVLRFDAARIASSVVGNIGFRFLSKVSFHLCLWRPLFLLPRGFQKYVLLGTSSGAMRTACPNQESLFRLSNVLRLGAHARFSSSSVLTLSSMLYIGFVLGTGCRRQRAYFLRIRWLRFNRWIFHPL